MRWNVKKKMKATQPMSQSTMKGLSCTWNQALRVMIISVEQNRMRNKYEA